jgi:hypothetical protein
MKFKYKVFALLIFLGLCSGRLNAQMLNITNVPFGLTIGDTRKYYTIDANNLLHNFAPGIDFINQAVDRSDLDYYARQYRFINGFYYMVTFYMRDSSSVKQEELLRYYTSLYGEPLASSNKNTYTVGYYQVQDTVNDYAFSGEENLSLIIRRLSREIESAQYSTDPSDPALSDMNELTVIYFSNEILQLHTAGS